MNISIALLATVLSFWVLLEMGLEYFFRSPLNANRQDGGHWHPRFGMMYD